MANQGGQGTGKHGHKDTQEPYEHHASGSGSQSHVSQRGSSGQSHSSGRSSSGSSNESLKSREYRGPDGETHHHTKTYEQQHKR